MVLGIKEKRFYVETEPRKDKDCVDITIYDRKNHKSGYIIVDREQKTNVPGVFAAGDCCDNPAKKIVTAAGDGGVAAESTYFYLQEKK